MSSVRCFADGKALRLEVDCPHVKDGACTECLAPLMAGFLRQNVDAARKRGRESAVTVAARRFLAAHLWYSRKPDDKARTEVATEMLLRLHVSAAKHRGWRRSPVAARKGDAP